MRQRFPNNRLPGRWIGRGGPTAWPPTSPDLTPLDLFLWGCVKESTYTVPSQCLKIHIRYTC